MKAVLSKVVPKMELLEAERQQLAELINNVKQLSIKEQAQLHVAHWNSTAEQAAAAQQAQKQPQQQQQQLPCVKGSGRQAQAAAVAYQRPATRSRNAARNGDATAERQPQREGPQCLGPCPSAREVSGLSLSAPSTGYYTSLLLDAAACTNAAPENHSSERNNSNDGHSLSTIGTTSKFVPRMCRDAVHEMDAKLLAWRTLSGARSAVTYVLRSEQLAAILVAAFPYLPMTGCMCDYIPAAEAAIKLRKEQQQQQ